jgi:hypothetical protein
VISRTRDDIPSLPEGLFCGEAEVGANRQKAQAMTSSFVGYVDESGDEGFAFERGSSRWFVLSCVILRKTDDLSVVKLVDDVRDRLGKPARKPLHFRDLRHEMRLPYVQAIAAADLKTVSVLIHKPSLKEPEKFQVGALQARVHRGQVCPDAEADSLPPSWQVSRLRAEDLAPRSRRRYEEG